MDWLKVCTECPKNSRCCCFQEPVYLSEEDKQRITEKTEKKDFFERGNKLKKIEGKCVFFENNKCSIHDFKPLDCILFPLVFWTEGGRDRELHFYLDLGCLASQKISSEWIEETKKLAKEKTKDWSEGELFAYDFGVWK